MHRNEAVVLSFPFVLVLDKTRIVLVQYIQIEYPWKSTHTHISRRQHVTVAQHDAKNGRFEGFELIITSFSTGPSE